MATMKATAARTVVAKSGMVLPATIDPQTEFNLIATAMAIDYKRSNGHKVAYDTIEEGQGRDAGDRLGGRDDVPADAKGEIAARVVWPSSQLTLSGANDITCKGYCTLRGKRSGVVPAGPDAHLPRAHDAG